MVASWSTRTVLYIILYVIVKIWQDTRYRYDMIMIRNADYIPLPQAKQSTVHVSTVLCPLNSLQ